MRVIVAMLLSAAGVAHAEERPGIGSTGAIEAFRLTRADADRALDLRVAPDPVSRELMPGDRSSAELCDIVAERPREPGARMRARMSMRLDTGRDAMRPDFALGGLGAVLARVTGVLMN